MIISTSSLRITKQTTEPDSKCPKCKEELHWEDGSDMENETWYCSQCNKEYKIQVELIRYWDTIKEIKNDIYPIK